jgi:hypothetical protein
MNDTSMTLAIVTETFTITGRGLVGALDRLLPGNIAPHVEVILHRPDGTELATDGYVEFILRRSPATHESSALFFPRLAREELPIGSRIISMKSLESARPARERFR